MRVGIDPGIDGAIACLCEDLSLHWVLDMPTLAASGKKRQVNGAELAKILLTVPDNTPIFIEAVSSQPGQGVSSMFNFGMSLGILYGVCSGLRLPIHLVSPGKWKKAAGLLKKEKDMARTLAQQLYPDAPLGNKRDIGRADAILIARFGDGTIR